MLNLPNILTLSRIMAIPLLAWFLWWPGWEMGYLIAFALYCLMGITDYFDGYLARTSGTVSKLGIFLDPIADKIMVAAVILVLAAQGVLNGPYVGDMHVVAGLTGRIEEVERTVSKGVEDRPSGGLGVVATSDVDAHAHFSDPARGAHDGPQDRRRRGRRQQHAARRQERPVPGHHQAGRPPAQPRPEALARHRRRRRRLSCAAK